MEDCNAYCQAYAKVLLTHLDLWGRNPQLAFEVLQCEYKIGILLPCNVIVQQSWVRGVVEILAVDLTASMQAVQNNSLGKVDQEARGRLEKVIKNLRGPCSLKPTDSTF